MTGLEIAEEIQEAVYERMREFGRGHEIKSWPLSRTEFDSLILHMRDRQVPGATERQRLDGIWEDSFLNSITLHVNGQNEPIRVFVGP